MKYTFHGKSAHAQSPWQGRSALDAVFLLFHSVDLMREHSEPQFRFHGIVSDGGVAPNIVPEMASATIWVRHLIDTTPVGAVSPRQAREMIEAIVQEPEVGRIYEGPVKNTTTFGAFVEILPGTEGLCHISELADERVEKTSDVANIGDARSLAIHPASTSAAPYPGATFMSGPSPLSISALCIFFNCQQGTCMTM